MMLVNGGEQDREIAGLVKLILSECFHGCSDKIEAVGISGHAPT